MDQLNKSTGRSAAQDYRNCPMINISTFYISQRLKGAPNMYTAT
uniref:Uncharacterized protein n=1 Tax=Arundo donax TaxID=35708 RepID=A0A0A9QL87_ARUDO